MNREDHPLYDLLGRAYIGLIAIALLTIVLGVWFGHGHEGGSFNLLAHRDSRRFRENTIFALTHLEGDDQEEVERKLLPTLRHSVEGQPITIVSVDRTIREAVQPENRELTGYTSACRYAADANAEVIVWGSVHINGGKKSVQLYEAAGPNQFGSTHMPLEFKFPELEVDEIMPVAGLVLAAEGFMRRWSPKRPERIQAMSVPVENLARTEGNASSWSDDAKARVNFILGRVWAEFSEKPFNMVRQQKAIAAFQASLRYWNRETSRWDWAMTQWNLAASLKAVGDNSVGTDRFRQAADACVAALSVYTAQLDSLDRVETQHLLGNALVRIGERTGQREYYLRGIDQLQQAVLGITLNGSQGRRSSVLTDLGGALVALGETEDSPEHLEQGREELTKALNVIPREIAPSEWALTADNLAIAEAALGERRKDPEQIRRAITLYKQVLAIRSREHQPLEWAQTESGLGMALLRLNVIDPSESNMAEAIEAYGGALNEYTPERNPLDWASAQAGLGNALQVEGENQTGIATLRKAEAAFRASLTKKRDPVLQAETQTKLSEVLWRIGERTSDRRLMEEGVTLDREALKVLTPQTNIKDWVGAQIDLGGLLTSLDSQGDAEESVRIHKDLLARVGRDSDPATWAKLETGLGNALSVLNDNQRDTTFLRQALEAYNESLKVYTPERDPIDWAWTKFNIGTTLYEIGAREDGTTHLEQSAQAFQEALTVLSKERTPEQWQETTENLNQTMWALHARGWRG